MVMKNRILRCAVYWNCAVLLQGFASLIHVVAHPLVPWHILLCQFQILIAGMYLNIYYTSISISNGFYTTNFTFETVIPFV